MTSLAVPSAAPPRVQMRKIGWAPLVAGIFAAAAMIALYIGILTALQSFTHALEQATQDALWVGLVALGFGLQIGMYVYLRVMLHSARAAGATAMTGAGAGTSTLGMIACCAHHLTDLAPLVALTGASGLSGAISFFTEYKYAFIALGLVMNALGILVTLRTIRRSRAHLVAMIEGQAETDKDANTASATIPCH